MPAAARRHLFRDNQRFDFARARPRQPAWAALGLQYCAVAQWQSSRLLTASSVVRSHPAQQRSRRPRLGHLSHRSSTTFDSWDATAARNPRAAPLCSTAFARVAQLGELPFCKGHGVRSTRIAGSTTADAVSFPWTLGLRPWWRAVRLRPGVSSSSEPPSSKPRALHVVFAHIAQTGEHPFRKGKVVGSIPTVGSAG
jgi:hypothetical protein